MLDYKMITFIKLCELMNYTATAQELNMTQPAVTQHIHYLEKEYAHKLFLYKDKKLSLTTAGKKLELYARSAYYNQINFQKNLYCPQLTQIKIGATKTIGEYVLDKLLLPILQDETVELSVVVENTVSLLHRLKNGEIDLAIIEGFFDKKDFGFKLLKKEKLVGICALNHSFANKQVQIESVFDQRLILREGGSGTRAVFSQMLKEKNYSLECFDKKTYISSFELIKKFVAKSQGVSFVYESVANSSENIASFNIKDTKIEHEFNYVFLKNTPAQELICKLEGKV